ncbi:MAG TPA: hypothetical protein VMT87_07740 [Vicinamibacteria bacterium]|nr:hypothetical protein [Vicinamibacteria bacterium]
MSARPGLVALALATGCGVNAREDLVGRYEATRDGRREVWTLRGDGTCEIVRAVEGGPDATTRCEWEWVDREDRTALIVTLLPGDRTAGPARHRTRYVLRPSRLPGGPVTIPLGTGAELRKVE